MKVEVYIHVDGEEAPRAVEFRMEKFNLRDAEKGIDRLCRMIKNTVRRAYESGSSSGTGDEAANSIERGTESDESFGVSSVPGGLDREAGGDEG